MSQIFSEVDELLYTGDVKLDAGDAEGALADFTEAIKLNPQSAIAYYKRSIVKRQFLNDFTGTLGDLNTALALDDNFVWASYGKGFTYYKLGQYQEAIKNYTEALGKSLPADSANLDPYAYSLYGRGVIYSILGEHGKAIEDFKKSIDYDYHYSDEAYYNIAQAYYALEDIPQTLQYLVEAMQLYLKNNNTQGYVKAKKFYDGLHLTKS